MNYHDLGNILKNTKPQTSAQLMESLPEEYRSEFVLMKNSGQKRQKATPLEPRIITFGQTGRLLMGWESDLDVDGSIEVQDLNAGPIPQFDTIAYDRRLRRLALKRGEDCQSCHGQRLHPNWHTYPNWPDAYGSVDHRHDEPWMKEERKSFAEFLSENAKKGIYRALGFDRKKITLETMADANGILSEKINSWNASRIAGDLIQIAQARPDLAAALDVAITDSGLKNSPIFLNYLPVSVDRRALKAAFEEKLKDTETAITNHFGQRAMRIAQNLKINKAPVEASRSSDLSTAHQVANLRVIVEDIAGLPTMDWATTKERGSYSFGGVIRHPFYQISNEYREWLMNESDLRQSSTRLEKHVDRGGWANLTASDNALSEVFQAGQKLAKKLRCEGPLTGPQRKSRGR